MWHEHTQTYGEIGESRSTTIMLETELPLERAAEH